MSAPPATASSTIPPAPSVPSLRPWVPLLGWAGWAVAVMLFAQLSACSEPEAAPVPLAAKGPPVSVAPAVLRQVRDSDEFSGRLEATDSVELRPRVGGHVDKVHFVAGQEVAQGQLLFSIDPATYRAEVERASAQLAAAVAQTGLARSELARAKALFEQQAISPQEFDQHAAALATGQAQVLAAQAALDSARLNHGYSQIRAPIRGRIGRAEVTEGNLVIAGSTPLARIVSLDRVYAYFDASEPTYLRYLKQARSGASPLPQARGASAAIEMGLLDDTGFPHRGRIDAFDNRLDAQTGAIRTRAVFDNRDRRFAPGMYARLRLVTGAPYDAVLTPERAIGTDQSKKFVLVVGADDTAQFREVRLGARFDGMRVIASGLAPGERVIVEGLQRVRPGAPVTPQPVTLDEQGQVPSTVAAAAPAASAPVSR